MTAMTDLHPTTAPAGWFSRSAAWLDRKGKGAWIAAVVIGLIFFWPIGLAILAYMIWSKRMFNAFNSPRISWSHLGRSSMSSTGNSAFDAYKNDTLDRLEREQSEFEAFLKRLRDSKDKVEFDTFMNERAKGTSASKDNEAA